MPEKQSSLIEDLEKLFGKFNTALKSNLEKYQLSDLYGYFLAIAFVTSISLGLAASFKDINNGMINFGGEIIIFTLLTSIVMFALFSYVFVHVYRAFYNTAEAIKTALSWQTIALFISILLAFVLASEKLIYGGFVIFGIILFIHPLMKIIYKKESTENFNKTLGTVYAIIAIIANLIQLVLKFSNLI